jgi:hypothetical protein
MVNLPSIGAQPPRQRPSELLPTDLDLEGPRQPQPPTGSPRRAVGGRKRRTPRRAAGAEVVLRRVRTARRNRAAYCCDVMRATLMRCDVMRCIVMGGGGRCTRSR